MRTHSVEPFGREGLEAQMAEIRDVPDTAVAPGRSARGLLALAALLVLLLGLGWQVGLAFAQEARSPSPAAQGSPAAAPTPQGVEEIVVTAQKREQLSQDVPIALTAITAATLQFRGIDDMNDLQMQVPGMQFGVDTGADQQIYIRGIGVDDASGSIEAPIATYVDGVYQTRTFRSPTLGIDLERVEVLKGPQGTLFGRNATGGAVNIILKPPSDDFTGTIKGGTGSYGQWLTQMSASGPLIKHFLDLGISGAFSRDGGWIINENDGRAVNTHQEGDGRIALSFHPLDTLSVDYDLILGKLTGGGVNGLSTNIMFGPPSLQKAAGLPVVVPPSEYLNTSNPWKAKFNFPIQGDEENTQNSGTIKWDFAPWASIKSITAFQEHTLAGIKWPAAGVAAPLANFAGRNNDDKAFTQELNLGGSSEIPWWKTNQPFTWILGAYYMHEDYASSFNPIYATYNTVKLGLVGREKLNDYSVFGDGTVPLPWNFSVFGGLRYTYDRKALNQTFNLQVGPLHQNPFQFGPYTPPLNIPGTTCSGIEEVDQAHNVSPRVGMGWAPLESINFYVKYSEGYNSGGHYYNACHDGYQPETLDTVEGGVKGRWFDGRLVVDASGYWNTFKQYQIFVYFPSATTTISEVINAPKAEMWGGEFQVTALPIEHFTVNLGLSLMHSQFDQLAYLDEINPAAGVQDVSGHQMPRAPNKTEQVGLEYELPVPWGRMLGDSTRRYLDLGSLRLRGEWFHTDKIVFRPFYGGFAGDNNFQNPYSIFNFYATLPTEDGKWSLRFFARNFTNTMYFQYKVPTTYSREGVGGTPPWFGGDLTYRW